MLFLRKIINVMRKCEILKYKYSQLTGPLASIDYEPPFTKEIISRNVEKLNELKKNASEEVEKLQEWERQRRPVDNRLEAIFCNSIQCEITLRESIFDSLEKSMYQRKDKSTADFFRAIDAVIFDFLNDIGKADYCIPVCSVDYFTILPTKAICLPLSDLENSLCYAILAHEVAHSTLASLALSLQTLIPLGGFIREEFSRRFGVKRVFLDKLIGGDVKSEEAERLMEDFGRYFRTYSELILAFVTQEYLKMSYEPERKPEEISREIFESILDLVPSLIKYVSVIEDHIIRNVNQDWIFEIIADIVATKIIGPLYFEVLLETLFFDIGETGWGKAHPRDTFRFFVCEKTLELMGFKDYIQQLENWRGFSPHEGLKELDEYKEYIEGLFYFVNEHLQKINAPKQIFSLDDFSKSVSLSKDLKNGKKISKSEKSSVILNAMSIAIRENGNFEIINRAVIESLSEKVK